MGRIAAECADFVLVVTSDNPRTEQPEAIIEDILEGMRDSTTPKEVICSRPDAIEWAIEHHLPGDVIILAGKGHEDYQIIGHEKHHMDEREIVAEVLRREEDVQMTIRLIMAFAIAFFVSSGIGAFLVPWLRKIKAGQAIREDGPRWHMSKSGTPTMGGIMFIAALAVVCLTVGFEPMMNGDWHIFCFVFALIFGAIGFLDDYEKLKKKQNLGLSAKSKFLLQLAAALAFVFLMRRTGYVTTNLYIPFWNVVKPLPEVVYFIFAAFVIVGTVNSVNLTDGVDGLAAGTSIPVCLFFSVLAYIWGEQYPEPWHLRRGARGRADGLPHI